MDRLITYLGQVPLETDPLNAQKFAMIGLAQLATAAIGAGPALVGLPCTPGSGLTVLVGAGQIYQSANIDSTTYSSLAADTAHQVLKQGIVLDPTVLSCPAPGTAGQSINYLVEVGFQEVDTGAVVLQYYNASNPSVPFVGPAGAGSSNATIRADKCVVQIKAGTAAATGSQVTPTADSGFIGAYVVTVANGASSIVGGNIATYAGAPFLTVTLASAAPLNSPAFTGTPAAPTAAQGDTSTLIATDQFVARAVDQIGGYHVDTGVANAAVVALTPAITAYYQGLSFRIKAVAVNTTACTLNAGGGAVALLRNDGNPVQAGDITSSTVYQVTYDTTYGGFLINSFVLSQVPSTAGLTASAALYQLGLAM